MALKMGDIVATLKADVTDFKKGLETAQKQTTAFQKTVTAMAKAVGTALKVGVIAGVTALTGVLVTSTKKAIESEQEWAKINSTLKATAKQYDMTEEQLSALTKRTQDLSTSLVKLGFDDEETANSFARFTQVTGDADEAQKWLNATLDLARARNVDVDTATTQMIMAYQGAGRVLKQFAIDAEDGATSAEILGLVTEKVGGQADEFAKSTAGQMLILKTELGNVQETIGTALLPVLNDLVKVIAEQLMKVDWEAVANGIRDAMGKARDAFNWTKEAIQNLINIIGSLNEWFQKNWAMADMLAIMLGGTLVIAIGKLAIGFGTTLVLAIMKAVSAFIALNVSMLPIFGALGLVAGVYTFFDFLSRKVTGFSLLDQLKATIDILFGSIKALVEIIKQAWDGLVKLEGKKGSFDRNRGDNDKREFGGIVNAGQEYIVGEKGAELFVPNTSGRIISNKDLMTMGGGGVTQNINVYPSDQLDMDTVVDRLGYFYRTAI